MRSVVSKMEDAQVLFCFLGFLAIWLCYGFSWAVLILFTIFLVIFTVRNYSDVNYVRKITTHNGHDTKDVDENMPKTTNVPAEFGNTQRRIKTITRRYVNPSLEKRDLPFTDLRLNRSFSPRRRNHLKSPEPLISQINRHLSFNNMSCYPERPRTTGINHQLNSTLNGTTYNNSYLLSPIKNMNTSQSNFSPKRKPCLNMVSSPAQERYSPRCFSILDRSLNDMAESPSMVKISQPSDAIDEPSSFESILQKRLQRTKENPCSRHCVLSALKEKNTRKRPALEADGSFLNSTYAVKRRRRDELDEFLDSVSDPSASTKVSSDIINSLKRRSIHGDPIERHNVLIEKDKIPAERITYKSASSVAKKRVKSSGLDEDIGNTLNKLTNSPNTITEEDSGVVLSMSDYMSTETKPETSKKTKSVTFSEEISRKPNSCDSSEVVENGNEKNYSLAKGLEIRGINSSGYVPEFQPRFFPKTSLNSTRLSPIIKAKEKKVRRRSHLTWKDLQDSRREAWQRSQRLLDDIEEYLAKEKGESSGLPVVSKSSSFILQNVNSIPKTVASSISDAKEKSGTITSNVLGVPLTSLPATSSSGSSTSTTLTLTSQTTFFERTTPSTELKVGSGGLVNFIAHQPEAETTVHGSTTTTTAVATQSFPNNPVLNPTSISKQNPNFKFAGPRAVSHEVKPTVSTTMNNTSATMFSFKTGKTTGNVGDEKVPSDFKFSLPKSPVRTGLGTNRSPAVSSAMTSSASSLFTGFQSFPSSSAGKQTVKNTSTTSTNSTLVAVPQITSALPKHNFFNETANIQSSTVPQTKSSLSTFSFQAPSTGSSTTLPQTTTTSATFSFQTSSYGSFPTTLPQTATGSSSFRFLAPSGSAFPKNPPTVSQLPSFSSSLSNPSGSFNINGGPETTSGFGGTVFQPSSQAGFSFASRNVQGFGSQSGDSTAIQTGASQPKSVGFTLTAPAVDKPKSSGGFNFNSQPTQATFNFGSPTPATGGFKFSASGAVLGSPFASSTPMPGTTSGMPGGAFALGSSDRSGLVVSKSKQRRRARR